MKPHFVDNQAGNTLAKALRDWLEGLRKRDGGIGELCISTCYFNPQGLEVIHEEARHIPRIRLLLGAEPPPEALLPRRRATDPSEPEWTRRLVHEGLNRLEGGLRGDRNLIPFDIETDTAVRKLLEFLHSKRIEVRRYEGHFLHAKAFIVRADESGVVAGSSNLTRAGMTTNLELNLGHYEEPLVSRVTTWFEDLWRDAEPYDLAAIYDELFAQYDPYFIYLKVLWHLYEGELAEEQHDEGGIPITEFQRHGVWRARRILAKYGGVLVADGVGLGKTFTAGEIIREYRERRQRVLLICPAALRDTTWDKFLNDYQLLVDRVSYEQLAADVQLGGDYRHLKNLLDDYALIVIDEAHNYRNPDATNRAGTLRRLLGGKRRDLLLLSATPVNNSLWDLYHLLRFFMKQDAALADRGVLSVRKRFEEAQRTEPLSLSPDLLYPVIDATTVKRTRRFVKRYYEKDMIRGPGGILVPIQFPKPTASCIPYDLDDTLPGFFAHLEDALMPETGSPKLKMARYNPDAYRKGTSPGPQDNALIGLIRSALLKRFESSAHAFGRTATKMVVEHETFLEALARNRVLTKGFFGEVSPADEDWDIDEMLETSENVEDASEYDCDALRADVAADLALLRAMANEVARVRPETDPKLRALVEELESIAKAASAEGIDDDDVRQKRKVLVFSHYADTVEWIEQHLANVAAADPALRCYAGRIASVSGQESRHGVSRESAVFGFTPVSSGAPPGLDTDLFDILVSTDVLAEGMNLQQCRNIINYDLPWNPMRLVQRHGRIDRIGSPHDEVFLRTFFPDAQLDRLLKLEGRVRHKLAQAAASVGVEDAPIPGGASGEQTFAETREEIEKLRQSNASIYEAGGTENAAQTGEEYRQELRRAVDRYGKTIENLPWRIGSGMAKGKVAGHFFCAQVEDRVYLRFVPLAPGAEVVSEAGTCLRLIECTERTPRVLSGPMMTRAYDAWQAARDHVFESWMYETDPANLQPKVRKLNREVAEFLRGESLSGIDQERLERCLDAVEAPWSMREENQLREVWTAAFPSDAEKAVALIAEIERIGAEPFHAPEPLPPIEKGDVHLVCWLAIESERA